MNRSMKPSLTSTAIEPLTSPCWMHPSVWQRPISGVPIATHRSTGWQPAMTRWPLTPMVQPCLAVTGEMLDIFPWQITTWEVLQPYPWRCKKKAREKLSRACKTKTWKTTSFLSFLAFYFFSYSFWTSSFLPFSQDLSRDNSYSCTPSFLSCYSISFSPLPREFSFNLKPDPRIGSGLISRLICYLYCLFFCNGDQSYIKDKD